jgi:hypothetical protein
MNDSNAEKSLIENDERDLSLLGSDLPTSADTGRNEDASEEDSIHEAHEDEYVAPSATEILAYILYLQQLF